MMYINCISCNCDIGLDDELYEIYEEMVEETGAGMICDDCLEGIEGTTEDRVYDEMVGK